MINVLDSKLYCVILICVEFELIIILENMFSVRIINSS